MRAGDELLGVARALLSRYGSRPLSHESALTGANGTTDLRAPHPPRAHAPIADSPEPPRPCIPSRWSAC